MSANPVAWRSTDEALTTPLQYLKGVGPKRASDLAHAGLNTVEDLLCRFPLRYEDRSRLEPIASLRAGRHAAVAGRILSCGLRTTRRRGFKIFEALVGDASGAVRAVWLNQPFLRDVFSRASTWCSSLLETRGPGGLQLTNPVHGCSKRKTPRPSIPGDCSGVREGGSLTTKIQRRLVFETLQRLPGDLPDHLPEAVKKRHVLPGRLAAFWAAHFPPAETSVEELNRFATPAQRRLIFEEAFLFQLGVAARRRSAAEGRKPVSIHIDDRIRESARRALPFRLTPGQRMALKEIVDDLARPQPMNRLLQGDVGSGKTIVALLAAVVAMENGLQVAFMAPTEILAEQHYLNISKVLDGSRFRVALTV